MKKIKIILLAKQRAQPTRLNPDISPIRSVFPPKNNNDIKNTKTGHIIQLKHNDNPINLISCATRSIESHLTFANGRVSNVLV